MLQRGRRPSSAETTPPGATRCDQQTGFNVAADRRRRRPANSRRSRHNLPYRFNVAADRRRRRQRNKHKAAGIAVDGFNVAADRRRRRRARPGWCLRHRRARFNVAADRRRRRRLRAGPAPRRRPCASTWPPTVVGGDDDCRRNVCGPCQGLQRGRRPSSAETELAARLRRSITRLQRGRRPSSAETSTSTTSRCVTRTCFNVAADRRRRRPVESVTMLDCDDPLQRGRRPSSAETCDTVIVDPPYGALQRGRRPSSAETSVGVHSGFALIGFNVAADRRRRRHALHRRPRSPAVASTWPPTVVGGDVGRAHHPRVLDAAASTWPPTVVGGDEGDRPMSDRPDVASTWPPTVVGGDLGRVLMAAGLAALLQRGRRPSSAETGRLALRAQLVRDGASTWPPTVVGGDPVWAQDAAA